jgi:hypothetical protein
MEHHCRTPMEFQMSAKKGTAPHEESLPLLFINHSRYNAGEVSRPSRKQVSAHVQRTIRKKKKRDAKLRLQIRPFKQGLVQFSTKRRDAKTRPNTSTKDLLTVSPTLYNSSSPKRALAPRPPSEAQVILSLQPIESSTSLAPTMTFTARPRSVAAQISMSFCECMLPGSTGTSCEILERILMISSKVLHPWLDRIFPIASEAEEHRKWVVQRAATSPLLCVAMAAGGAAALASSTSVMGSSHSTIIPATARSFEAIAMNLLRTFIGSGSTVEPSVLPYAVMCLLAVAVIEFASLASY